MDFRFRGKSGRAADITGMTEFGPNSDIERSLLLQCTALTPAIVAFPFGNSVGFFGSQLTIHSLHRRATENGSYNH
jgi:hypothetical protein